MQTKLFIIDDDEKLNRQLSSYLSQFSFSVRTFVLPGEAISMVQRECPDCIILDIMLPQMDGFAVCKEIRKFSSVPIIMLTARGDVTDRIVGLEIGADDYLPKPFEPRELIARIQAILRRKNQMHDKEQQVFGDLTINFADHTVHNRKGQINLTGLEFDLLAFFSKRPGRVVDRDAIMDHCKGMDCQAFDRSIDVAISRLRQKIGDNPRNPRYFKTIRGKGYLFIGHESVEDE
jgi:two-component system phosphate regulon response regulator OmpR